MCNTECQESAIGTVHPMIHNQCRNDLKLSIFERLKTQPLRNASLTCSADKDTKRCVVGISKVLLQYTDICVRYMGGLG